MEEPIKVNVQSIITGGKRKALVGISRDAVDRYMKDMLTESSKLIRDYARKHHRYENDTGRLTRAIKYKLLDKAKQGIKTRKGERYEAEVYIDEIGEPDEEGNDESAPYGRYQHEGHKKRTIRPTEKGRLVFESRRYGRWFSLMEVRGLTKNQFLYEARRTKRAEVIAIFNEGLRRLIDGKYD